ncbi:MAG: type VI secretion system-associated FHA domain protein TagH [Candidatus Thiodiazotropha sp.]
MNESMQSPTLLLQVNRIAGESPSHPLQACFDPQGGTIGRRDDNDWVLPDPQRFISGCHALISFIDGRYWVTDVSSNGVYLNHAESPLGSESQAPLRQGDSLTIGEYEISVTLQQPAIQAADAGSFDALEDPYARLLDQHAGQDIGQDLAPFAAGTDPAPEPEFFLEAPAVPDLDSEAPAIPTAPPGVASESNHVSDLNAYVAEPAMIPEDWQVEDGAATPGASSAGPACEIPRQLEPSAQLPPLSADDGSDGQPATAVPETFGRQTGGSVAQGEELLRRALARGMGISHTLLYELPFSEVLENLGRILHSNVEGAMSILRARAQMKSEFRMSQTMIRPTENNPLKFSVNAEEALRHIIDPRPSSGYLSSLAAFREAHEDTEAHMLAVMVGMQSALKAVLQRFKPENLEQRLEQKALLDKVPLYRRAKSWELFNELYGEIAREVEDDFQQVFGRAFSQAYEGQIRRLANLKNNNDTTPS